MGNEGWDPEGASVLTRCVTAPLLVEKEAGAELGTARGVQRSHLSVEFVSGILRFHW